jgi:hypothetical protein
MKNIKKKLVVAGAALMTVAGAAHVQKPVPDSVVVKQKAEFANFIKERKARFAKFKRERNAEFENFVLEQNEKFEKIKRDTLNERHAKALEKPWAEMQMRTDSVKRTR